MAVLLKQLEDEVLTCSLRPNESLSQFSYPYDFIKRCKVYLCNSPAYENTTAKPRFPDLNFDGFISYNYHEESKGGEGKCGDLAKGDLKKWQTAIICLQKYCRNLLLAPRRRDFHLIKVKLV